MDLKRGDIVIAIGPRAFGKPRPALVVQTNALNSTHSTIIVALISSDSTGEPYRVPLDAGLQTGLRQPSEVMVDKIFAIPRDKIASVVGRLSSDRQGLVDRALAFVTGMGEG